MYHILQGLLFHSFRPMSVCAMNGQFFVLLIIKNVLLKFDGL
jgi:hypothetical protein